MPIKSTSSICAAMLMVAFFHTKTAYAYCSISPTFNVDVNITGNLTLNAGHNSVGTTIAWYNYHLLAEHTVYCDTRTTLTLVANDSQLTPTGGIGRYETGIAGTELEIGFGYEKDSRVDMFAGWQMEVPPHINVKVPRKIIARIIRTDSHVARSGQMRPHYTARLMAGTQTLLHYGIQNATFNFKNDVMLMSCHAEKLKTDVEMGRVDMSIIRSNFSAEKSYSFDIKCSSSAGESTPVKVYFEGDTTADGVLRLSNAVNAASGIGLSVFDANGTKLPFKDRSRSLQMNWRKKVGEHDYYRFEGKAKYVPLSANLKPGQADASMSYILDYN